MLLCQVGSSLRVTSVSSLAVITLSNILDTILMPLIKAPSVTAGTATYSVEEERKEYEVIKT